MNGQPPASLSTELGCQADKNYGVETRANRIFKSIYVYSKEDYVDYPVMSNEKTLNCGHAPMGKFFHCSSCREKKCPTCWMRIKDHVINQVMSRWIADMGASMDFVGKNRLSSADRAKIVKANDPRRCELGLQSSYSCVGYAV